MIGNYCEHGIDESFSKRKKRLSDSHYLCSALQKVLHLEPCMVLVQWCTPLAHAYLGIRYWFGLSFTSFGFHHNMKKPTEFLGITLELISELHITNPPVYNRVNKFLEPESFIDNSSVGPTCILQEHTSEIFLNSEVFKILKRALDTNIINLNMSRNYPNNIKPPWLYI